MSQYVCSLAYVYTQFQEIFLIKKQQTIMKYNKRNNKEQRKGKG